MTLAARLLDGPPGLYLTNQPSPAGEFWVWRNPGGDQDWIQWTQLGNPALHFPYGFRVTPDHP